MSTKHLAPFVVIVIFLLAPGASASLAQPAAPPTIVTIEIPTIASSDDAGINAAGDWCFYGTGNNEIYFGQCADGTDITSGFRFTAVPIPRGAAIVDAYLHFTVDGPYIGTMTVRFRGEASGNALTFSDASRPVDRPLIPDVTVDWLITPDDPWTVGETRVSPPLTEIVQAIVDRDDWESGNALAVITENVGTPTGNWLHRRVFAYDRSGSSYAARLVVTYEEPAASPSPPPDWSTFGGQAGARMGRAATSAGDVNGDGFDDLLVSSEWYDNGQIDEGRVCVYHGSAAGLPAQPDWCAESDAPGAYFGYSASTAGDINGDGYADVIIAAPWYANGQVDEGCAYLYLGSPGGLAETPAWTWESDQDGARLGLVSAAGDVNDDGYSDVLVGAPRYDSGQVDEGKVFLFLGTAAGLGSVPDWDAESDQAGALFGLNSTAGDVNGDGCDDVIVSALRYDHDQTNEGGAFLYLGSAEGLATAPAWTAESDQTGAEFGTSISTAGDVNGDGFADVVVGARFYTDGETYEGAAFVYLGSAAGLSSVHDWMVEGNQPYATFGMFTSTAGDVNGDGFADLMIASPSYDAGEENEGRVYLYRGSASGLPELPDWTAEGNQEGALFGYSGPGHAGDVNGDGYDDIAIGALWYDQSEIDEGAAFVYHGGPTSTTAVALQTFATETERAGMRVSNWIAAALLAAALVVSATSRRLASHRSSSSGWWVSSRRT